MYLQTILLITAINYVFIDMISSGVNNYKKSTIHSIGYMLLSILPSIFIYGILTISVGFVKAVIMAIMTFIFTIPGMVVLQVKVEQDR